MKPSPQKDALLICPPWVCPVIPGFLNTYVAGVLLKSGISVSQYDVGLDLFLTRILPGEEKADNTQNVSAVLSTGLFYQPDQFLAANNLIHKRLLAFSRQFVPQRIRWNSISPIPLFHRQSNHAFVDLCHTGVAKQIRTLQPESVIFCLSSTDQVSVALAMADFIRLHYPDIKRFIIGDTLNPEDHAGKLFSCDPIPATAEGILGFADRQFMVKTDRVKVKTDRDTIKSDFGGLNLTQYQSPKVVFPVDASFFRQKDQLLQYLRAMHNEVDAKGFVVQNPGGLFDFLGRSVRQLFFSSKLIKQSDDVLYNSMNSLESLVNRGLILIEWSAKEHHVSKLSKLLWKMSKHGVWNHIYVPQDTQANRKKEWFEFISSNPNIAHSYTAPDPRISYDKPCASHIDPCFQSYSNVAKLPGTPFWKSLEHPVHMMLYLEQVKKDALFAMRVDDALKHTFKIGGQITFHFKKPDQLSSSRLDEICKLVEAGGSVDPTYVRYNLERAFLIGYAMENGVIVGNSSLKHPREQFIQRLNRIAGFDFTRFVERGYTSVRPEYRALGVGAKLLAGLTKRADDRKVFSIISEDNEATRKIALKNKTRKIVTYYSDKLGKYAGIWMPEHMIEDHWEVES